MSQKESEECYKKRGGPSTRLRPRKCAMKGDSKRKSSSNEVEELNKNTNLNEKIDNDEKNKEIEIKNSDNSNKEIGKFKAQSSGGKRRKFINLSEIDFSKKFDKIDNQKQDQVIVDTNLIFVFGNTVVILI
uniref:Uncharacterized protein n=1 Tax=Meloidogyne enterolobii TaxID=390850 RepID=A0A6V7WBF2_MELEN|nr:unnamed protein product [Meloidogyne enterolobii]